MLVCCVPATSTTAGSTHGCSSCVLSLSHCVMHADPLQTQVHDDSGDESDGDDSAADTDADTGNAAPADASSDTSDTEPLIRINGSGPTDVKSVYFSRVLVWL